MILIHSYFPEYVKQLLRTGIAKKGDGYKINQSFKAPVEKKFNEIAKKDGEFYNFIKEYGSCVYVDRLQGGVFYHRYDFDKETMELYNQLPGVEFLGVQLHELATTRAMDWKRIQKCLKDEGLEWNEKNIYESVRKISTNKDFPHFSQGPASEYAALTPPKTMKEYAADMDYIIQQRQKETHGNVLKCDSNMYCASEEKYNVRHNFVEVGAQRAHCRIQYAMRRGISTANGKKWGTYIEPWGGKPVTTYRFERNGANDWHRPLYKDVDPNEPVLHKSAGENGGSSMSLAGRLMFYSLFAGSDYFAEEWGAANTFYDWGTGELTPYGVWKKKMADLSRRLTNVKADVPIAIIMPKEYQIVLPHCADSQYENDMVPGEFSDITKRINRLFSNDSQFGMEDKTLTVGRYGSLFDIIYDDTYEHPEQKYAFIVDLSGKFAGKLPNAVDAYDEEKLYARLDAFVAEYLPFTYTSGGDFDYTLFENDGEKFCAIFNHNGLSKTVEDGESVNPEATISVSLKMKNAQIAEVMDFCDCGFKQSEKDTLDVVLTGGTFILFRYA